MTFDFEKTIVIPDPPSKYIVQAKKKIDPSTGRLKEKTFYLSANLFFGSHIHYHDQKKVVMFAKNYLNMYFQGLPKLQKLRIYGIYSRPDKGFDLDNKSFFWQKCLLDLLKTPSDKQRARAIKEGWKMLHLNRIPEDGVQYVDELNWKYEEGPHQLIFNLKGVRLAEQQKLFN